MSIQPSSFDRLTRGYLLKSVCSKGAVKPKSCSEWHQYWCVLDGSSLLCYDQDEDEAVKQYKCDLNLLLFAAAIISEWSCQMVTGQSRFSSPPLTNLTCCDGSRLSRRPPPSIPLQSSCRTEVALCSTLDSYPASDLHPILTISVLSNRC